MDPLAKGTKSIKDCHENESDRSETLYEITGCPCLLLDRSTEVRNIMCGKCGAVERALCGGPNGGLFCLCTSSYSVGTGGSAFRHETRKLPLCFTRKTAIMCYT